MIDKIYEKMVNKKFVYKRNKDGRLISPLHGMLLADFVCSALVCTFVKRREKVDFSLSSRNKYLEDVSY